MKNQSKIDKNRWKFHLQKTSDFHVNLFTMLIDFWSILGGFWGRQGKQKRGFRLRVVQIFTFSAILREDASWTPKNIDFGSALGSKLGFKIDQVGFKTALLATKSEKWGFQDDVKKMIEFLSHLEPEKAKRGMVAGWGAGWVDCKFARIGKICPGV